MNPTTIEANAGAQSQATTFVNPMAKSLKVWRLLHDKAVALTQEYEDTCLEGNPDQELEEKATAAFRWLVPRGVWRNSSVAFANELQASADDDLTP